jgi:hypothetical protein
MAVNATNLIMGAGELYFATFGATEPSTVTTAPTTPWANVGATTDGVELHWNTDWAELEVDQLPERVGRRMTSQELTLVTNLAETTLANLALVTNGPAPVSATGTLTFEPIEDVTAFNPTYRALIFDGIAPGGKRRRVIARKVLSTDTVDTAYTKGDMTVFNVTFTAHYVSPTVKSYTVIDDTSA